MLVLRAVLYCCILCCMPVSCSTVASLSYKSKWLCKQMLWRAIASLRGRSRQRAHGLAAPFPTLAEHSRGLCERCVPAESRRGGFAPHSPPCTLTVLCLLPNPSGRSLCVT